MFSIFLENSPSPFGDDWSEEHIFMCRLFVIKSLPSFHSHSASLWTLLCIINSNVCQFVVIYARFIMMIFLETLLNRWILCNKPPINWIFFECQVFGEIFMNHEISRTTVVSLLKKGDTLSCLLLRPTYLCVGSINISQLCINRVRIFNFH